tara:strand:- start:276 stop:485 length:210 start_codon:yes stop_codon:yes gene_type:complete
MSGETFGVKCKECSEDAWAYRDWKPVQLEVNECPHYECGFMYYLEDGIDRSRFMSKEEILDLRKHLELE